MALIVLSEGVMEKMEQTDPEKTVGPLFLDDGQVRFALFSPSNRSIDLCLEDADPIPMVRNETGWFEVTAKASHGDRYTFRLPGGLKLPDPASRFQPGGVHDASELVDLSRYDWETDHWIGIDWASLILYELHVGAFSKGGTYREVMDRLDDLVDLGITAIELMPLAQSAGSWNWGYDGVNLFAPRNTYGRPEELMAMIDQCHSRGIAVILDVVYNHFGPEGNYLGNLGGYLSDHHTTPWGDAPNFDGPHSPALRGFFRENIRYWIEDLRFDGLRLDATHCMMDQSDPHIVREIGDAVEKLEHRLERKVHLIAESNVYDPELLRSRHEDGYGFDGLWCDDFVHSLSRILLPDINMSDRDYHKADLNLVLRRGYVFHGTLESKRSRHSLMVHPDKVAMESLVVAIQNHDFIGNHPGGLRLHQTTSAEAHRASVALLLVLPSVPMVFMGEEFACEAPFYFFADFEDGRIRDAVETGRRSEHRQHAWKGAPSPLDPASFEYSKVGSSKAGDEETLSWYQRWIALRKQWIQEGVLSTEFMTADWDDHFEVARIVYRNRNHEYFVMVRVHESDEDVQPVNFAFEGKILIAEQCEIDNSPARANLAMKAFGVAVGRGRLLQS